MSKFLNKAIAAFVIGFALFFSTAVPALAAPGTRVYSVWAYRNVVGAGTTTVKSGAGILHTFCVNTIGTTLVLFDNTAGSGNKIGSWTTTAVGCYSLDVNFTAGLTAVTVGTSDITVAFQ